MQKNNGKKWGKMSIKKIETLKIYEKNRIIKKRIGQKKLSEDQKNTINEIEEKLKKYRINLMKELGLLTPRELNNQKKQKKRKYETILKENQNKQIEFNKLIKIYKKKLMKDKGIKETDLIKEEIEIINSKI